jgi:hypothetical protein
VAVLKLINAFGTSVAVLKLTNAFGTSVAVLKFTNAFWTFVARWVDFECDETFLYSMFSNYSFLVLSVLVMCENFNFEEFFSKFRSQGPNSTSKSLKSDNFLDDF